MEPIRLRVASPCNANWSAMKGDDTSRFCQRCQLNVYNLSEMTDAQARTLIAEKEGRLCVRFYRRADGTVLTKDCPDGVHRRNGRIRKMLVAGLGALAAGYGTIAATFAPPKDGNQPDIIDQLRDVPVVGACVNKLFPGRATMGDVAIGKIMVPPPPKPHP